MDPDVAQRLARRYPARRRFDWRVLAAVLALVGLGWIGWVAADGAVPPVSARVDAFQVVSDTEVAVVVTIEREHPDRGATCLLYVQAVSYERVGELWVDVPAGGDAATRQDIGVRTFKRGTSAALESCRAVD